MPCSTVRHGRPRARPHHFPHTGRPIANGPSSALLASPSAHGSLTRARARARAPRLTPHTHTLAADTIGWQEVILTILYSIAGLGIAIVNDFKSIEGDRALGMNSLPVAFGIDKAKWICVASIDITQLSVAAYLYLIGETTFAAVLFALVLPQMFSQISFLQDPVANDVKYQAAAQPFLVFGILTTACAVGHHAF
jgi:hypothetical protein